MKVIVNYFTSPTVTDETIEKLGIEVTDNKYDKYKNLLEEESKLKVKKIIEIPGETIVFLGSYDVILANMNFDGVVAGFHVNENADYDILKKKLNIKNLRIKELKEENIDLKYSLQTAILRGTVIGLGLALALTGYVMYNKIKKINKETDEKIAKQIEIQAEYDDNIWNIENAPVEILQEWIKYSMDEYLRYANGQNDEYYKEKAENIYEGPYAEAITAYIAYRDHLDNYTGDSMDFYRKETTRLEEDFRKKADNYNCYIVDRNLTLDFVSSKYADAFIQLDEFGYPVIYVQLSDIDNTEYTLDYLPSSSIIEQASDGTKRIYVPSDFDEENPAKKLN